MDVDITIAKYCLENSCCVSIYFLYSIKATLCDGSGDDEEIKLIIYPIKQDKGQKCNPVNTQSRPVERFKMYNGYYFPLISQKYPGSNSKREKIEKMVY